MYNYADKIMEAGERHRSLQTIRIELLLNLKKSKVDFKEIEEYLLEQFKVSGVFTTEADLEKAKSLDLSWYHNLQLFLGWIDRNWVNYDKKKGDRKERRDNAKKKAEAKKVVTRTATVTAKKAKALLENPEALQILIGALTEAGYTVTKG